MNNLVVTQLENAAIMQNHPSSQTKRSWLIDNLLLVSCAFLIGLGLLWNTLNIGFLLDDFYHVNYLHKALDGDWRIFLKKLWGNWSGDADGMTSYRPLLSVALYVVFSLGRETALSFHIANILLLSLCSVCIFHLTNILSNVDVKSASLSKFTAFGAMLLFLTYPLHLESSVTATNEGDLLSGFFYLVSLLTYYKYKSSNKLWLVVVSLLTFLCALFTKEIAVTLPAVISVSSLIYHQTGMNSGKENGQFKRVISRNIERLYWLALGVYCVVRTLALGTVIGGYGGFGLHGLLRQFYAFLDLATMQKLFFPLNEHMQAPSNLLPCLSILYTLIALHGVFLLLKNRGRARTITFLVLWIVIGVLPTFQIWHIYPNLLGSRLFFISSIPFCILLSLLATSDIDFDIKLKKQTVLGTLFNSVPILFLCLAWSTLLETNLIPYKIANAQLERAKVDLYNLTAQVSKAKIVLLALPQDYCGAPMIGRAEFLRTFCKPPCMRTDLSDKIISVEPPSPGAHEFILIKPLLSILQDKCKAFTVLIWSKESGCFVPWKRSSGAAQFEADLNTAISSIDKIEGSPEPQTKTITFKAQIDTIAGNVALLHFDPRTAQGNTANQSIRFFWHSDMPAASESTGDHRFMSVAADVCNSDCSIFDLQKYPQWTYATKITDFGIEVPKEYRSLDSKKLSIVTSASIKPEIELYCNKNDRSNSNNFSGSSVLHIPQGQSAILSFSADKLSNIRRVRVEIPKRGTCFSEPCLSCYGNTRTLKTTTNPSGQIRFSESELRAAFPSLANQVAQLRVVALDARNEPVGIPSEPSSFTCDAQSIH